MDQRRRWYKPVMRFLGFISIASSSYLLNQQYTIHKQRQLDKLPTSPFSGSITDILRKAMQAQQKEEIEKSRYFFEKALLAYLGEQEKNFESNISLSTVGGGVLRPEHFPNILQDENARGILWKILEADRNSGKIDRLEAWIHAICARASNKDTPFVVEALSFLGNAYKLQDSISRTKSQEYLESALTMYLKYMAHVNTTLVNAQDLSASATLFKLDAVKVSNLMESLAEIYEEQRDYKQAYPLFHHSLRMLEASSSRAPSSLTPTKEMPSIFDKIFHVDVPEPSSHQVNNALCPVEKKIILMNHLAICTHGLGNYDASFEFSQKIESQLGQFLGTTESDIVQKLVESANKDLEAGDNGVSIICKARLEERLLFYRHYLLHVLQMKQSSVILKKPLKPFDRSNLLKLATLTQNTDLLEDLKS